MATIVARLDPSLHALLASARPLTLPAQRSEHDIPEFVRAGSAIRRWGQRLVIVQDDVHALALLDEATEQIAPLLLPHGADGRRSFAEATGNKAFKLDLEACVTLPDGRLLALGSGSKPVRERIVVVSTDHAVRVIEAQELYAALRSRADFAGAELNLEGAVIVDGVLRLFQRGNGAATTELAAIDATVDLDLDGFSRWLAGGRLPTLERVRRYDLGAVAGVRFGFTDAAVLADGRVAFVAGAEASPDAYHDGEVLGCRFGIVSTDGDEVRVTDIVAGEGVPEALKLEGIEVRGPTEGGWEFAVVTDMDTTDRPALLGRLLVRE